MQHIKPKTNNQARATLDEEVKELSRMQRAKLSVRFSVLKLTDLYRESIVSA